MRCAAKTALFPFCVSEPSAFCASQSVLWRERKLYVTRLLVRKFSFWKDQSAIVDVYVTSFGQASIGLSASGECADKDKVWSSFSREGPHNV